MANELKGVCFGEVLFDVFQEHKKIGGAPFNVASRIKSFGEYISIISAVGNDNDGKKVLEYVSGIGIETSTIQVNDKYETGFVQVTLNEEGNASYDISYPSAWDKIESSKISTSLVKESDFFVYGSLVSRDIVSRNTLYQLIEVAKYKIFDVNLRFPHYTENTLIGLMNAADLIKFNEDELHEISKFLESNLKSLEQNIKYISEKTNTDTICVTLGPNGAVLYCDKKFYYHSGFNVKVVDTVGSGDSFLAALIVTLLAKKDPQEAINFACAIGAIVAQKKGANPNILLEDIQKKLGA